MINIPKGTKDFLPFESYKIQYLENAAREVARLFAFKEIRTPVFEHTELFQRGVGGTTDIVNKEMYTFLDKGNRSITLKPEGTAGVARSYIENSLYALPQPIKMYYISPIFRYERPQSGRLREHHQFGVEMFGASSYEADVEVISLAKFLFDRLGLKKLTLKINSIGCPECRGKYNQALKEYFAKHIQDMCPVCKDRLDKNPLRILDCKEENCIAINKNAPKTIDYLCKDCAEHMEGVKNGLSNIGVDFVVDPRIVRGLDYYTRTVFEFISDDIGAQGTVCGGGRYDGLVSELGGKPAPAVGFGMGLERLLLVLEALNMLDGVKDEGVKYYVAPAGKDAKIVAEKIVFALRRRGISADTDLLERSLKAQLKFADKRGAENVVVIGEDELQSGKADVKNMATGETEKVDISELMK